MNIDILRINKSTAKRAHIILLLPFLMAMVSVKNAIFAILLTLTFTAIAYGVFIVCQKYLSIVVAYPITVTFLGAVAAISYRIPDFYGFSMNTVAVPAIFFTLFLYKYLGAVRDKGRLNNLIIKFAIVACVALVLSAICEIVSYGTLFDFAVHSNPIPYFATYSGVFLILSVISALINIIAGEKFSVNRSFNMKKGSVRLVSYSAVTALIALSVCYFADNFILVNFDTSYLSTLFIFFMCGLAFIAYRLIDKKVHIGKHAANVVPSLTLLICLSVYGDSLGYTDMLIKLVIIYMIFVCSVYLCELLAMRSSITDKNNPFYGAPATLMMFSVAALVLESLKTVFTL